VDLPKPKQYELQYVKKTIFTTLKGDFISFWTHFLKGLSPEIGPKVIILNRLVQGEEPLVVFRIFKCSFEFSEM
jgi:hypothetical protein